MTSVQPSDEDLDLAIDEIRLWEGGLLPELAYTRCANAWPRVRLIALHEWQQRVANPLDDSLTDGLSTLAWYLAATNRDIEFLKPLLESFKMDEARQEILFGDILTTDGSALAALMASRNPEGVVMLEQASWLDPNLHPFFNTLPIDALSILVAEGIVDRERFDRTLRKYIDGLSAKKFARTANLHRAMLIPCLCDLGVGSFADEIRSWFDRGKVEMKPVPILNRADFEKAVARGLETPDPKSYGTKAYRSISEDTYESMRWMMWEPEGDDDDDDLDDNLDELLALDPDLPLLLPEPKIGRNEPCPCGSGKKYKRCCGSIV